MRIYKINEFFVNSESSTEAIKLLKSLKKILFVNHISIVCITSEIIPTLERPFMKLYKVNDIFVCASNLKRGGIKIKIKPPKNKIDLL